MPDDDDDDLSESDLALLTDEASRIAAADQEVAEWGHQADKLATYWSHLMASGMPKNLAGILTINAQNFAHEDDEETIE